MRDCLFFGRSEYLATVVPAFYNHKELLTNQIIEFLSPEFSYGRVIDYDVSTIRSAYLFGFIVVRRHHVEDEFIFEF